MARFGQLSEPSINLKSICTKLIVGLILLAGLRVQSAIYYAATNGLPGNTGTIGSPWDLRTGLTKTATLVGGDTLRMLGGTYTNLPQHYATNSNQGDIWQATIAGAYNNPIIIESNPGDWAMLDGGAYGGAYAFNANARPTLLVGSSVPNSTLGRFLHWRNFEVFSSSTEARFSTNTVNPSFPNDITRSDGINVFGVSNILDNIVVHDLTTGISAWEQSSDTWIRNCLMYNNGWSATAQQHGHGIYTQNKTVRGLKIIQGNVIPNNYDNAVQAYGSGSAEVEHYRISQNLIYNNRLLLGGRVNCVQGDNQITDNLQWNSMLAFIYFKSTNAADIRVTGNYVGVGGLQGGSWTNAVVTNNTVIYGSAVNINDLIPLTGTQIPTGWTVDFNRYQLPSAGTTHFAVEGFAQTTFANWKVQTGWDASTALYTPMPSTNLIVLQPNLYDTNKANIAVYNWSLGNTVAVNISLLGFTTLDSIRVRNAQDYFVDVTTNSVPGNILTLPMQASAHTVALPNGAVSVTGPKSFPQFGAFMIERIATAAPTPTNVITITSTPTSGVTITATSDINGNGSGSTTFVRNYLYGTPVTLVAPSTAGTNNFSKWQRAGADFATTNTVSFTVVTNETWQAVYVAPPTTTWKFNISSSNPASGVTIGHSPNDNGGLGSGVTTFSRTNNDGVSVTITAPATASGNNFQKWSKNGVDFSVSQAFTIVANSANLVSNPVNFVAFYTTPAPPNRDLIVSASNPAAVAITVTPADVNGLTNGTTGFTRTYALNTSVQLTAPPMSSTGTVFSQWVDDGGFITTTTNVSLTMTNNRTFTAQYVAAPLPFLNQRRAIARRRGARF